MSDEKTVIIGDTRIHVLVGYAATKRSIAVTIALELIKATCAGKGPVALEAALSSLSAHADKIQEALKGQE